jgi:hypothetical protein
MLALAGAAGLPSSAGASILPCGLLSKCPPPKPEALPPSSARPVHAGAQYDGHAAGRWRVTLNVARDGTRLSAFQFVLTGGRCGDGGPYASNSRGRIQDVAVIDSSGHGSYTRVFARAYSFTRRGVRVTGREQVSFSFRFEGDRVQGVLRDRFGSKRLSCANSAVAFTAYRDGTEFAPLATNSAATGRYAGTSNRTDRIAMQVFLPQDLIVSFSVAFRPTVCTGGLSVRGKARFTFYDMVIRHDRFRADRSGFYSGSSGDRYAAHLSGVLYKRADGRYFARGTWRYTDSAYRGTLKLGACTTRSPDRFTLRGQLVAQS